MDSCEVVIVGGGPAGSTCAWELRNAGIDSIILDAQDFPRTKLCAGWITPEVVRNLQMDLPSYPHSLVVLNKILVEYSGKRSVHRLTLNTTQYSIRRYEFDHWLLQRSGTRFRKHRVRSIRREGGYYLIDDRYRCHFLIGAAGTSCPVRRTFFADVPLRTRELQVGTLEEEFYYPDRDETCRLWFAESGLAGYSWYVPKGKGWVNIGLGVFSGYLRNGGLGLWDHWRLFTRKLSDLGLIRGRESEPGGYTYFVRAPAVEAQRDSCFLIGDSAGLATRNLGEGIGPAVESGLRAARAIISGEPYSLNGMARYSYFFSGWPAQLAERILYRGAELLMNRTHRTSRSRQIPPYRTDSRSRGNTN